MARKREHKHDLKPVGFNVRVRQFPGHIATRVKRCRTCGAEVMEGLKPDPDYVPAKRGRPRDVLAWIDARL